MKFRTLVAAMAVGLAMASANASNFSFTGNFVNDNDVQQFSFSVGAPSMVTLRSWSYAGGTNAAGQSIARGGFDPILALFTSTGTYINQNDDGGCNLVASDALTGMCWDTFFSANLTAGDYIATVQQYDNFTNGPSLTNGFRYDGAGNEHFRNGFVDVSNTPGSARDSHWAFDILNVNSARQTNDVPEPASIALLGLGIFGLGAARRKSKKNHLA